MPLLRRCRISVPFLFLVATVIFSAAPAFCQGVPIDPSIGGLDLQSSPAAVRKWAKSQGLKPAEATKKGQELFLLQSGRNGGKAVGFIPGKNGLNQLFYNYSGMVPAGPTVNAIIARYGKPEKTLYQGGFKKLFYRIENRKNPGIMVWAVRSNRVGVELLRDGYQVEAKTPTQAEPEIPAWKRLLVRWWRPALLGIVLFLGFFVAYKAAPKPVRRKIVHILDVILGPLLTAVGFLGSRIVTFFLAFITMPLMLFSACAVGAGALEKGTSWWWAIPWVIGAILMIESDDTDDFRYVILANICYVLAAVGVFFQMPS